MGEKERKKESVGGREKDRAGKRGRERETDRGREIGGGGARGIERQVKRQGQKMKQGAVRKAQINLPMKQPHRFREQTFSCQGGGEEGRDGQGVPA